MLKDLHNYMSLQAGEAIHSPVLWYGLAFTFLLIILWLGFCKFRTELVSVFSDEEGSVHITPQALRELVRKSCAGIDGIHSPSTSIRYKGRKVRLKVKIRLEPSCQVMKIRSLLTQKLEKVMVENLNFKNFEGVDVIIRGFQSSKIIEESD